MPFYSQDPQKFGEWCLMVIDESPSKLLPASTDRKMKMACALHGQRPLKSILAMVSIDKDTKAQRGVILGPRPL